MVTTICMNPSFDKTVTVDTLTPGRVNRIRTSRTDVGGKGINVAIVAHRLGLEAQVVGLAGEDGMDKLCAAIDREQVKHAFWPVPGSVRVNTKIVSLDGSGVTELNEPGPVIGPTYLSGFRVLAASRAQKSDYAVLTGSLPPGCPATAYRELIKAMDGVKCILDVGGEALVQGAEAKPFLIKPNHHELAAAVGRELVTIDDMRSAAQTFVDQGVQHVIVSMGRNGALYVGQEGCFYAPEIPVAVHSTVGAGDAMVGGLMYGFIKEGTALAAFRCGMAAGTASVMTEGTQLIVPEDFMPLLSRVQVQVL